MFVIIIILQLLVVDKQWDNCGLYSSNVADNWGMLFFCAHKFIYNYIYIISFRPHRSTLCLWALHYVSFGRVKRVF